MKRSIVVTSVAVVCVGLFLTGGTNTGVASPTAGAAMGKQAPERGGVSYTKNIRGNAMSVFLSFSAADGQPGFRTLVAGDEIDVTSATFSSRVQPLGTPFQGSVYFEWEGSGGGLGTTYPINLYSTGTETIHLTFTPPMRFQAGDTLFLQPSAPLAGGNVLWEMALYGYAPDSARGTGMVVK